MCIHNIYIYIHVDYICVYIMGPKSPALCPPTPMHMSYYTNMYITCIQTPTCHIHMSYYTYICRLYVCIQYT